MSKPEEWSEYINEEKKKALYYVEDETGFIT